MTTSDAQTHRPRLGTQGLETKMKATRIVGEKVFVLADAIGQLEDSFLSDAQALDYKDVSVGMNILTQMREEADATGNDEVHIKLKQYRVLRPLSNV